MPTEAHNTFEITITGTQAPYEVTVTGPGAGKPIRSTLPPIKEWLTDDLRAILTEMAKEDSAADSPRIQQVGNALYGVLFTHDIRAFFKAQGSTKGETLRIRLQIRTPELIALPWEAMHDGTSFLAMESETPIVRRFPTADNIKTPPTLTVKRPLRVLFVGASPRGLDPAEIDIRGAEQQLAAALKEVEQKRLVLLYRMLNPTIDEVQAELLKDYHILVFLGHGAAEDPTKNQKACIYLDGTSAEDLEDYPFIRNEPERRGAREKSSGYGVVQAEDLAKALEGKATRLVFLAACNTAAAAKGDRLLLDSFAQTLAKQTPAIVAMQYVIGADSGAKLAEFFLRALAEFRPVDLALVEARNALPKPISREHFSPVMYLQADSGQILDPVPWQREALFDGLIKKHSSHFAGRDTELAALRQFIADRAGGYMVVTAPMGFGKTALMANLVDKDSLAVAYYFFNPIDAPGSLDPETFFRNIVEIMAEWHQYRAELPKSAWELASIYHDLIARPLDRSCTLVLDGLDEVSWSEDPWKNYSGLLAEELPANMHIIVTIQGVNLDWEKEILGKYAMPDDQTTAYCLKAFGREQVKAVFRKAGAQAPAFIEAPGALDEIMRVAIADPNQPSLGTDPFVVAFLAQDAAEGRLKPGEISTTQPVGLENYLGNWLKVVGSSWWLKDKDKDIIDQKVFDLFGTLAVAKGPLSQSDLEAMNKSLRWADRSHLGVVIDEVRHLVQGGDDTGYSLMHPRLREPLQEITPVDTYRNRLLKYCGRWKTSKSRYALKFYARHLAERAQQANDPAERHRFTEQLVELVINPAFQRTHREVLGEDLAALRNDLDRALRAAAQDNDLRGLPLLVESAQALVVFDQQQLRPEPIFAAAEKGDVDAALRLLNVFDIDRDWRQAAQLLIAWLAVSKNKEATRKVRDQIVRETPALAQALDPTAYGPDPLRKMLGYLAAGLDDSPAPALDFPPTPYEHVVVAMVAAVESAEVDAEMLGRLQSGQIQYLAESDGLPLVAFANEHPSPGDQYFDRYVAVLAGYGYREYRDKSLWWMLDAALFHPDQLWIQDRARLIVSSALAESKVRWRGSLPLTALALRAWMGEQKALDQFQAYIAKVAQDTEAIIANETLQQDIWGSLNETPQQDIWGSLRRCLAAIAEVQKQLLDLDLETKKYLELSKGLRRGFAGFKVPAYLNLAEAMCIGSLSTPGDMDSQIKDALLSAAHNIQDPVFCARSTARADAMIEQQWKTNRQGASVAQIIDGFIKDPFGRDFAALHRIGDGQKYARRQPNNRYPLPPEMRDDSRVTLSVLAKEVYRCPSFELQCLNPQYKPDDPLLPTDKPSFIHIPDPGFAPWLAARFAAEALVASDISDAERVQLIQRLAPIAAPDPTALDTVLARLLLAAHPLLLNHPEHNELIAAITKAAGELQQPLEQHA